MAQIQAHRGMPERELAAMIGVSHGTVQRYRREIDGEQPRAKLSDPKRPTIAEQLARRAASLPRYDTMTREERGMGSPEYGAEQHPDYPKGWTRDHVHREKYGRIQLFTPKEQAERELVKQFEKIILALNSIVTDAPAAKGIAGINYKSREMIEFQLAKFGPRALDLITEYLACIRPTGEEMAS